LRLFSSAVNSTEQEEGEHHVRLLDHLVPVNDQRMVVEEQREAVAGSVLQVPGLSVEEAVVLGNDAGRRIEGDVHFVRRLLPRRDLRLLQAGTVHQGGVVLRVPLAHAAHRCRRVPEILPRHQVGVGVVVDDGIVLVRSGHPVDAEAPP
jgi:hypothetical protein